MNRPRWQKVISDLSKNKTRSLLVVASIAVGLFAVGIILQTYLSIRRDMQQGFAAIHPANIQVRSGLFDEDLADTMAHLAEIDQTEAVRRVNMQVYNLRGTWQSLDMIGLNEADNRLNQVEVLRGAWPADRNQVLLADNKLSDLGVEPGDRIEVKTADGRIVNLTVSGIVRSQSIGSTGGSGGYFNAPVHAYVLPETLEHLGVSDWNLYNELYVTIRADPMNESSRAAAASAVRTVFEDNDIAVNNLTHRDPYHHPNAELVDAIMGILVLLGFLVVFLSAFLITNTLQSLLDQQTQQIGIMKTVGARSSAINRVYMALIAVFGVLAFLIAFPAAALVSNQLVKFLAQTINFRNSAARFEPLVLALVGGLALVIPQAAAFFPIRQGTHISVREALSGIRQNQSGNDTWIDRRINALQGLPRPFSIALRNVFRRKGRLVLTLITLTLGGAVFISVFNVRVALTNYVDQLSQYFLADVNLTLEQPERVSEVAALLAQLPQIERVEAWGAQRSAVLNADGSTGESLNMIGVPGGSQFIQPIMLTGRWLIAGDENAIVLNDQFQRLFPDLKVGDTLALQVNDRTMEWQVVGFFQLAGKIGGLAAYVNEDYLQTLPGMVQGRAANFRIAMNGPASAGEQEALAQAIQTLFEDNNMRIADLTTGSRINNTSAAGFNILTSFLLILAILTALVGSIGLAGTMSMNVMDRTREIGVMRSIGASNPILMRMVIVEGLLIGWLSWLLGALLSFPIGQFMSDMVMRALFGSPSPYGFTLIGFTLWFVLVSVLSVVASIVPARSAAQLTIREVLAYE